MYIPGKLWGVHDHPAEWGHHDVAVHVVLDLDGLGGVQSPRLLGGGLVARLVQVNLFHSKYRL